MLKFFLEYGVETISFIVILTQVIIPTFIPELKFFWLFRSDNKKSKQNYKNKN